MNIPKVRIVEVSSGDDSKQVMLFFSRKRGPPLLSSVVSSTKTRNVGKSRKQNSRNNWVPCLKID